MAWTTTFLFHEGELRQAPLLLRNAGPPPEQMPEGRSRSLLVFVEGKDLYGYPVAYTKLSAWPIWLETSTGQTWVDFGTDRADLTTQERVVLRDWLVKCSSLAWSAADPAIHELLLDMSSGFDSR